jgi:hypothetical protein
MAVIRDDRRDESLIKLLDNVFDRGGRRFLELNMMELWEELNKLPSAADNRMTSCQAPQASFEWTPWQLGRLLFIKIERNRRGLVSLTFIINRKLKRTISLGARSKPPSEHCDYDE